MTLVEFRPGYLLIDKGMYIIVNTSPSNGFMPKFIILYSVRTQLVLFTMTLKPSRNEKYNWLSWIIATVVHRLIHVSPSKTIVIYWFDESKHSRRSHTNEYLKSIVVPENIKAVCKLIRRLTFDIPWDRGYHGH